MKPFRQRRHAHTRGWRSQDRIWYSAMFLDPVRDFGRAVYLSGNGFRVVGRIGIDDGSGQVVWQRRGVGSGEWSTIAPWRRLASRMDATDREPNAWAPLEGDVWSDLPPPITSVKARRGSGTIERRRCQVHRFRPRLAISRAVPWHQCSGDGAARSRSEGFAWVPPHGA
jgi:hypothetical protein